MKAKIIKRIVSITAIALVGALLVTTIVLALVPKKMENFVKSGYAMITVYQGDTDQLYTYSSNPTTDAEREHNEIFRKIEKLHAESLEDSLLSALFQGTGSFDVKVQKKTYTNILTSVAEAEGNAIVFTYLQEDPQVLKIDGKEYRDESSFNSKLVTYNMIVLELTDSKDFDKCKIYFADRETRSSSYYIEFLARQAELNDYISSLNLGQASV